MHSSLDEIRSSLEGGQSLFFVEPMPGGNSLESSRQIFSVPVTTFNCEGYPSVKGVQGVY